MGGGGGEGVEMGEVYEGGGCGEGVGGVWEVGGG